MTEAGPTNDPPATAVGDGKDFDGSYPELFRVAYQVAFRLVGERSAAEDVAQESLARACAHWRSVRRHPSPRAWVATTAANLARNQWRADTRRSRRESLSDTARGDDGTRQRESDLARRLDLHAALRQLPRRQRQVLVLRYLADLPEHQVAEQLGCSTGTVKQHAARALQRLRTLPTEREDRR